MRLEPLSIIAGGIVFWLIVVVTGMVGKRVADGQALHAILSDGNPLMKIKSGPGREGVRLLLSMMIAALFALTVQTEGIDTMGRAVAMSQLMMMIPVTFIVGIGVGAKAPASSVIRAGGLFVAATVAAMVIFALAGWAQ